MKYCTLKICTQLKIHNLKIHTLKIHRTTICKQKINVLEISYPVTFNLLFTPLLPVFVMITRGLLHPCYQPFAPLSTGAFCTPVTRGLSYPVTWGPLTPYHFLFTVHTPVASFCTPVVRGILCTCRSH
jgi:hypothetical protein